ncbi:MAG TPA: glycosyltransferase family 2 protein [Gemmatimonadaceae bacterium]
MTEALKRDPETLDIEFSIVSGSSEPMLARCIESLFETMKGSEYSWLVTVTCNTPGDGLPARLSAAFPSVQIIENSKSRGFAANHNTVLAGSRARYVWLLNDDLIILPDTIDTITRYLDAPENDRVAAVSPKLLNPDGSLQPSTYSFPSMPQTLLAHSGVRQLPVTDALLSRLAPVLRRNPGSSRFWAHDRTVEVETMRGACVAMRMEAVRDVGLMVEVALVGGEETEWHRRLKEHGWKVVFFADASVIHFGSQTVKSGSTSLYPEYLKGALYFFRTSKPRLSYAAFCVALMTMFGARAATAWMTRNERNKRAALQYLSVSWDGIRERF